MPTLLPAARRADFCRMPSLWRLCFAAVVIGSWSVALFAAGPEIREATPRGLTIGDTVTLRIVGANLQDSPRLVVGGDRRLDQTLEAAAPGECKIAVTLPSDAAAGIMPLRIATNDGISQPFLVGVDRLPQASLVDGEEVSLPIALTGNVSGSKVARTSFQGQQGQRVVIDLESRRLGAKLDPVVRLLDERGTQIAWSSDIAAIGGDARCTATLPADGAYTVTVHDKLYRGTAPGHFRMKIGDLHYADFVLPMGATRGQTAKFELIGAAAKNLPAATLTPIADGAPVPRASVPLDAAATGSAPSVFVTSSPELLETRDDDNPQSLSAAPVAVSGRISVAGESDRYTLPVTPGTKLRIELYSARIGAPLDGVMDVLRDNGQRLASNDDQPGTSDPGLDVTVPGGVNSLTIAVRDMLSRGGPSHVYRLSVRPLDSPDFALSIEEPSLQLPAGSPTVVKVTAQRHDYHGPIKLIAHRLPGDVAVAGSEIPSGSNVALLTLTGENAGAAGICVIEGHSVDLDPPVRRVAKLPESEIIQQHPHLAANLGWAVTQPAAMQLAWNLPSDAALKLGGTLAIPVTAARTGDLQGEVRLTLLTNQIVPKKKVKNEKTKKDELVDDLDRALRIAGEQYIAADASETEVQIQVPADLPARPWDFVLKGELLSADKKKVIATAYTSLKSLPVVSPLRLELATSEPVQARAGLGETGSVKGTVLRDEGFDHPVTVALTGLPKGYQAGEVTVAPGESTFELPIRFAYGTKPGKLDNVRVQASAATDPEKPAFLLHSKAVPVPINVVPGEKPAAQQPLTIFEDEQKFVAMLNQGNGQISLHADDKQTGKASVKVTPDQRYAPSLPTLGKKIRENPSGPDEFRYLRFAWKKAGGNSICLQINHDGDWGPGGNAREGAKFRYHAGPGGECYQASLVLDEELPGDWVVVTRDLFADFGEFTFTGIALSPVDGEFGLYDTIYLGKSPADFELIK